MNFSQQEFESILTDKSKQVSGNIIWVADEDHSPASGFKTPIHSEAGYPLVVCGYFNPMSGKLSFAIIHQSSGRIYALDLGADHRNPDGDMTGDPHKHRWREGSGDNWAYSPEDITEPWNRPLQVWEQFCSEANVAHSGMMDEPSPMQGDMML